MRNKNQDLRFKEVGWYLLKFGGLFCLLYFGSQGVIGLSTPGNYYSPFVDKYLDFISPFRASLLYGSKGFLSLFGYHSFLRNDYVLALPNASIRIVYSCLGLGIMSFWAAFVFANKGSWKRKTAWIFAGLITLWCINILRVSLLLMALQNHWSIPFGWDHHTWFNIVGYGFIFLMIFLYDRSFRKKIKRSGHTPEVDQKKIIVTNAVNESQIN